MADRGCARNVASAFEALARNRHPVIIAGNYSGYVKGIGRAFPDAPFDGSGADVARKTFPRQSRRHRREKPDRYCIFSTYSTGINTAKCAMQFGADDIRCTPAPLARAQRTTQDIDAMISALRNHTPALTILDPKTPFSTEQSCTVSEKDLPYFRDTAHLTNEGSAFLVGRLKYTLLPTLTSRPQVFIPRRRRR